MIEVENLSKRYGDTLAVDGLDFVVRPGVVTGFLGPNGSGKSTTMRMIAGLDRPTTGRVTVNGGNYRSAAAPMAELGVLLEAKAVHTGRSARNHLLALARTNGISKRRVAEVIDIVGLHEVAGKRVGGFSLGMGQRLGVASALLGNPQTVVLDEPVNGLDPEGVRWIRTMLKDLATDGHTVFVSSHLMSEMAQTATRLVVIGRGRLIADTSVDGFIARASHHSVIVRTPDADRLRELLSGPDVGATTAAGRPDVLHVSGLTAEHIGTVAWQHRIAVFELTVQQTSLEEAFMTLTDDSVEYRSTDIASAAAVTSMTDILASLPTAADGRARLRVTPARVVQSEWTKFRSLRSTVYTVLVAVALMIGLGALLTVVTVSQPGGLQPGQSAISTTLTGTFFAQLAIGVLGALLITGEYSTGMIRSSLTVVPRRLPMFFGKIAVFAGVVFLTMLMASVAAFFVGQAIFNRQGVDVSLATPGATRSVIGAALYVTVAGMIALAMGALLRNTAAAITTFVAVFFVIPPLTLLLPASWTAHFVPYLPSSIGEVLTGGTTIVGHSLAPWPGFAVLCGYAAVLIGFAAWRLRHADA